MDLEDAKRLGRDYMTAFQDQDYAWRVARHDDALPFKVRGLRIGLSARSRPARVGVGWGRPATAASELCAI